MANGKWISYLRVSTDRQGKSGLGVEAQRAAVNEYLNGGQWSLVHEFCEVESGKSSDRPQLAAALAACRLYGAKLVIAKLDRLSRDAHFLLGLDKAGVEFVAADMPNANRLTVGIMAMVAEQERTLISARTKAALVAAKARGTKLGGLRTRSDGSTVVITNEARQASRAVRSARAAERAADVGPTIRKLQAAGSTSLRAIASGLNDAGIPSAKGGQWSAGQIARVLERLDV